MKHNHHNMQRRDEDDDDEDDDDEDDDDEDDEDDDDKKDDKKDDDNKDEDSDDSSNYDYYPVPGEEPGWPPFGYYPWEKDMIDGWRRRETAPEHDSVSDQERSYKERHYGRDRKRKFQLQEEGAEVVKVFSYCTDSGQYLIWGRVKDQETQEFKDEIMWVKYPDFPSTTTRYVAKGVKLQALEAYDARRKKEEEGQPRMTSRERRRKKKEEGEGPRMTRELMEKQAKAWMAVKIAKKQWKKLRQELNQRGISPMKRQKKEGKYFLIH